MHIVINMHPEANVVHASIEDKVIKHISHRSQPEYINVFNWNHRQQGKSKQKKKWRLC